MRTCSFCKAQVEHPIRLTTVGPAPFVEHELLVCCLESTCILQLGQVSGIAVLAANPGVDRESLGDRLRRGR